MKIVFELPCRNKKEINLREKFCELIIDSISKELIERSNLQKIEVVSRKILSLRWISWISKPVSIDPLQLMNIVADNLVYRCVRNNVYVVEIDPTSCYPGSNTKLERFVRFLDRGNMSMKGSHVFSEIFNKYNEDMSGLWRMYKSYELKRFTVDNSFIIK